MKNDRSQVSAGGAGTFFLSLASVISAFAVVSLHANSCFRNFDAHARYWITANFIECFFYFAVPVFFMISGATLLDFFDRYGLGTFFRKRFAKTVVPYCFWSLFALAFQVFYLKNIPADSVNPAMIRDGLLNGKLLSVYWYFPTLFKVYLCIPLFAAVDRKNRKKVFIYLAAAGFLLNHLFPFVLDLSGSGIPHPYSVAVVSKYLIFLPIGWLLKEYDPDRKTSLLIWAAAILGFALQFFGTWKYSVAAGAIDDTFREYTNVPCILWSAGVFLAIKKAGCALSKSMCISRVIRFLSGYTFSLYLLHWFMLRIFEKEFHVNTFSIFYRLGAPWLIAAAVIGLTWLLRHIPFADRILPG